MTLVVGMSGWWFHQIRLGAHLPISQQTSTYWEGPPSPRQSSSYRDRAINKTNNLFSECFHSSGRIQTASRKSHLIVGLTLYAVLALESHWRGCDLGYKWETRGKESCLALRLVRKQQAPLQQCLEKCSGAGWDFWIITVRRGVNVCSLSVPPLDTWVNGCLHRHITQPLPQR